VKVIAQWLVLWVASSADGGESVPTTVTDWPARLRYPVADSGTWVDNVAQFWGGGTVLEWRDTALSTYATCVPVCDGPLQTTLAVVEVWMKVVVALLTAQAVCLILIARRHRP